MRQAIEKMSRQCYSFAPVLNKEGQYMYTVSAYDLLCKMKNEPDLTFNRTASVRLTEIPRHQQIAALSANASWEEIYALSARQNFIPLVDDFNIFIGIITRRELLNHLLRPRRFMVKKDKLPHEPVNNKGIIE